LKKEIKPGEILIPSDFIDFDPPTFFNNEMTASKIFFYFCLSFIAGLFLSSFFSISQPILLSFLILGILLISVFWRYKTLAIIGFGILFLVAGIWRYQEAELRVINNELKNFNDTGQEIALIGIVSKEPDIRGRSQRLTIKIKKIEEPFNVSFNDKRGKVLVTTQRYPAYQYGDKLEIKGKLETPPVFEGFNYQQHLQKEGIYSVMSWPEIELVGKGFGNSLMTLLFSFKNKFQETANDFISPPQSGILEALIFGEEENLSKEWKEKLNLTGTRHIAAVSGMNITILAFLILNFLLFLGFWRQQAFYLAIFLLILYILMIGAPPSAVRAGIMGGLLMTAQYFGRLSGAVRAITFAAFFMLFVNPLILRLDIGFQLSFLATFGLIYLQPSFFSWFKFLPNPKFFPLRMTLSATLAAQIFTLPILVYNFGQIPLISPITNILIVPFLAPITILIFVFGLAGMIFWSLGFVLSWFTWLSLTYIISIVDWFSQLSFASLTLQNVPWIFVPISYLILGFFVWRLQEEQKFKFLKY